MRAQTAWERDASDLLESRIVQLRGLAFEDVRQLPSVSDVQAVVLGEGKGILNVFVQPFGEDQMLVVAQCSRSAVGGMIGFHQERGLVFDKHGAVREATSVELENSGG